MQLDLVRDRPEDYSGRDFELHGTLYRIGSRLDYGEDWQTHLLVNQGSGLALHQIQLPGGGGSSTLPPPISPGSLAVGTIQVHPLPQPADTNAETAAAWTHIVPDGPDAVAGYHAILKINPRHNSALYSLCLLAARAHEWGQAQSLVSQCLDIEPNWLPYQLQYFWCCFYLRRPRLAAISYRRIESLFPGQGPHTAALNQFLALGELAAAEALVPHLQSPEREQGEALIRAEGAALEQVRPRLETARQALAVGDDAAALKALEEAWDIQPRAPWLRFNLALARWRDGRLYDSWAIIRPVLNLAPLEFLPTLGLHLATMCIELGWLPNALSLLAEPGTPMPTALARLRWKDDQGEQVESSVRPFRLALFELASGVARAGAELPPKVRSLLDLYQVPVRTPQYVAGAYQVEAILGSSTFQVRHAISGARYAVRFKNDLPLPLHPHLLTPLFKHFLQDRHALFFPFMPGGTLGTWIETRELYRTPQPDVRITRIALQLAYALEAAHEAGVTHGDVHPDNVLMSEDGVPRLLFTRAEPVPEAFMSGLLQGVADPEGVRRHLSARHQEPDMAGWVRCVQAMGLEVPAGQAIEWLQQRHIELTGEPYSVPACVPRTVVPPTAEECLAEGDYAGALEALRGLDSPHAMALRSTAERRMTGLEAAKRSADAALSAATAPADVVEASIALSYLVEPAEAVRALDAAVLASQAEPEAQGEALAARAYLALQTGETAQAVRACEAGLSLELPPTELVARLQGLTAFALWTTDPPRAQQALSECRRLYETLAPQKNRLDDWMFLTSVYTREAEAAERDARLHEAAGWYEKACSRLEELLVGRGCSAAGEWLAEASQKLANVQAELGATIDALRHARRAVSLWRNASENRAPQTMVRLARAHVTMARTLAARHYFDLAYNSLTETRQLYDLLRPTAHDYAVLCLEEGIALKNLGHLDSAVGRYQEAVQRLEGKNDTALVSLLLCNLGNALALLDRSEEALAAFEQAIECWAPFDTKQARLETARARRAQGNTLLQIGRNEEAVAKYELAEAALGSLKGHAEADELAALVESAKVLAMSSEVDT